MVVETAEYEGKSRVRASADPHVQYERRREAIGGLSLLVLYRTAYSMWDCDIDVQSITLRRTDRCQYGTSVQ
jgi:hypothetical protein